MGPGENAGAVDVGGGHAIAFKVESHNHPSAVEPFQGAATGVGGILRDVFALGARPIAILDSLRFGELSSARSRFLLDRVVEGIGHYGNSIGVPTVGGEIYFEAPYEHNCLVNAMCVGLAREDRHGALRRGRPGQRRLVLLGASTGRDGIGGASVLASAELAEGEEKRPTVQIGDPFEEKKLMECCLELLDRGLLVSLQDLGAAGLTSSAAEMAAGGGVGLELALDRVPLREADMEDYEIMVSESQERMLAVVDPARIDEVLSVCERWQTGAAAIGEVTETGAPAGHPRRRAGRRGAGLGAGRRVSALRPRARAARRLDLRQPGHARWRLDAGRASSPPCSPPPASLRSAGRSSSTTRSSNRGPCAGRSRRMRRCCRIDETGRAIAVAIDGNGRRVACDPYLGTVEAVLECAQNLACVGAEPLGLTNCLNFGNPEKPHVAWQLDRSVQGLADACAALGVPVVGGNVSLYNETEAGPIYPTPVVGMVGELPDPGRAAGIALTEGDAIALVGPFAPSLAGSELAKLRGDLDAGLPAHLDRARCARRSSWFASRSATERVSAAHDVSDGGLACALAECAIAGGVGVRADLDGLVELRGALGRGLPVRRGPGRVRRLGCRPAALDAAARRGRELGVDVLPIGEARRRPIRIAAAEAELEVSLDAAERAWRSLTAG